MADKGTVDIDGGFKPDLDTTIAQSDDTDIEVSFVEDDAALADAEAATKDAETRKAQNDPGERYDPADYQQRQWSEREAQFVEREERYAKALAEAEKRRVETERESAKVAVDGIDLRIRTTVEAIKAAKSEGDVSAEVDFTQQLQGLRDVRQQILTLQGQLPSAEQIDRQLEQWKADERAKRPASGSAPVGAVPGNELATRYMHNNAWMNDPNQAQARSYLLDVDRQLAKEGYDPKSPQHFEELSRRVAARFPSVGVKMLDGRAIGASASLAASRSQSPPVASARATSAPVNGNPTGKSKTAVQLTQMDRQMMRAMGLDASDKRVQAKYAREKMARLQSEQR